MQIEYRTIAQSEYGAPESVLRIVTRRFKNEDLGPDDVLVKVRVRPVHPGDIQILSALPQGGLVQPIPEGSSRVPGFGGVGTVARLGTNLVMTKTLSEGQRVAFFPAMGSWAEYVSVPHNSLLPVPDSVPDPIAAQMLINYDHRIRSHQSRSQFTQGSDYATCLHPSECGGIWRWAVADSSCFGSGRAPHSSGEIESIGRKTPIGSTGPACLFNKRQRLEKRGSPSLGRTQTRRGVRRRGRRSDR